MKQNTKEPWQNIVSILVHNKSGLRKLLVNDEYRIRVQFILVYVMFVIVSSGMTVVNVATSFKLLMYSTLYFAIANVINIALTLISRVTEYIARTLFAIEIVALFAFFTIIGEPEGFSIIWIAMLPTCGLLLYRLKYGVIISLCEEFILMFLLWTDYGNSLLQFEYTTSMKLRFPILYFAFFAVGAIFEYIRASTSKALYNAQSEILYLAEHDSLTGLYNRMGFNDSLEERFQNHINEPVAFAIGDIDHFKATNDTYGHINGDIVLAKTAELIKTTVGDRGKVSRWGGEEFAIMFNTPDGAGEICEAVLEAVRSHEYALEGATCRCTISLGLFTANSLEGRSKVELVAKADANLYDAKQAGRDRLCATKE